ncbi:melanocortin receptor 5-like [Saccostrea echinata]|uniref:melanocortin receptor 5-like n=1 Tax=Saccostrea echinata TaxID=191078 RepID=UPI002A834993|nr:melanocortin receptor 5-like [Saccostrea echinata]
MYFKGMKNCERAGESTLNNSFISTESTVQESFADEETRFIIPVHLESEDISWLVILIIIIAFGILANLTTIGIIIRLKQFHKPTYMVIGALAIADFVSLIQYLCHLILAKTNRNCVDNNGRIFMTVIYSTAHASASHVVLLLGLRYYLIAVPLRSRTIRKRHVLTLSILMWIFSVVFGVIYYFARFNVARNKIAIVVLVFRGYLVLVPCIFMLVFHMTKIYKLRTSISGFRISQYVRRMSAMILIIMVIYIFSAIIFPITFSLNFFKVLSERESKVIQICARVVWLFNLSVNPIIYFIYSPKVRRSVTVLWKSDLTLRRASRYSACNLRSSTC